MNLANLSRTVSHALRHEPWLYELELDDDGWVPVHALLRALDNVNRASVATSEAELEQMVAHSEKKAS